MEKKRSKIIKDLIMDKINVLQAMQSLDLMLEDIEDRKIKKWVGNELNGYRKSDKIPNYRILDTIVVGKIQVGYTFYNNIEIPIINNGIGEKLRKVEIKEPLSAIIQLAKAENECDDHYLALNVNIGLINQYQKTNGDVIQAQRRLGIYAYNSLVGQIKDKLLEIFKILEKKYGNLDDLYIDFSDNKKKEETKKEIESVIYNDYSINIGDNNTIDESVVGDKNGN